jgi:hypothetical protein
VRKFWIVLLELIMTHNRVYLNGNTSDLRVAMVAKDLTNALFIDPFLAFIAQDIDNKGDAELRKLRFEIHRVTSTEATYNLVNSIDPANQQTVRQSINASASKAARKAIREQY